MIPVLQVLAGFAMLGFGGDALVKGAVGVADSFRVSKLFIGLVLVGFGTSTPELATSLSAALEGAPEIAVGNVLGSNIANTLLILGVTATIASVVCDRAAFRRDAPVLAAATLAVAVAIALGGVSRLFGAALVSALIAYASATYLSERRSGSPSADILVREAALAAPRRSALLRSAIMLMIGVGLVMGGAVVMVDGASALAASFGVPEAVIGLTVVAVGTSLPELAASISAARKGETDLAYGNIIGSNIFNILGILGLTAAIAPITGDTGFFRTDAAILVAVTALLFVFSWTGRRLSRAEGWIFLAAYSLYVGALVLRGL